MQRSVQPTQSRTFRQVLYHEVVTPVKNAPRRIGIHLSTSGGTWTAVQRALDVGANCFQIFSSSPRQWKPTQIPPDDADC